MTDDSAGEVLLGVRYLLSVAPALFSRSRYSGRVGYRKKNEDASKERY
jgi:hypothetical protein